MTAATFVVPYERASLLHVPRRDLVLAGTDSVALRVSIVQSDDPNAAALEVTGGIGGPAVRMVIWRDTHWRRLWDYGLPPTWFGREVIWSGAGVRDAAVTGSFDIAVQQGTMADWWRWPRRCGFSLYLDWDGGLESELLAEGSLHLIRAYGTPTLTAEPVLTDTSDPVTEDDLDPVTTT